MYNYVFLIGKVAKINIADNNGSRNAKVKIICKRPFHGSDKSEDVIVVDAYSFLADVVLENVNEGDSISVKGRLVEDDGVLKVVAEQIISISSKKEAE